MTGLRLVGEAADPEASGATEDSSVIANSRLPSPVHYKAYGTPMLWVSLGSKVMNSDAAGPAHRFPSKRLRMGISEPRGPTVPLPAHQRPLRLDLKPRNTGQVHQVRPFRRSSASPLFRGPSLGPGASFLAWISALRP